MEEKFEYEYNKEYKPSELKDFPTDIIPKRVEVIYTDGKKKNKLLERVDESAVFLLDRLTIGDENRITVDVGEILSIRFIKG